MPIFSLGRLISFTLPWTSFVHSLRMIVVLETEEDSVSCGILNNCSRALHPEGGRAIFSWASSGGWFSWRAAEHWGTVWALFSWGREFQQLDTVGVWQLRHQQKYNILQWCCSVNSLEQTPVAPWSCSYWQAADKLKQVWGMLVLLPSLLYLSWCNMQIHEMVLISSALVFKYYAFFLAHTSLLAWTYLTHRQCEKTTDKNL